MTKKILSLLAIFIFATNAAAARESDPEPSMDPNYGIRIGTNWSSIRNYGGDVLGWQVGGAMDIPLKQIKLGPKWALINLQPEAMFVSKGGEQSVLWISTGAEASAYYVEVPISASFKFFVNENFAVRIDIGPYVGVGLFGEKDDPTGKMSTFKNGYYKGLNRVDFGRHDGIAIQWSNYYFAATQSVSFTGDYVNSAYLTLGYNF